MKTEQDYIKDLTEIRSIMERSTKFLTLTGWAGIMIGIYALAGAYIGYKLSYFDNNADVYNNIVTTEKPAIILNLFLLAIGILILSLGTAIFLSYKKSKKTGDSLWNAAARRLVINMAIPLVTGGLFILILYSKGLIGLIAPVSLIFYGMALLNGSKFTFEEYKYLGIIEIMLGLLASLFIGYGLLFWIIGFGVMHIVYGIYMHLRYEK
ncbi:MAG TPA: hypothetical protein VK590_00045 [Saprospiraceae bacterium]|nr:hypothetical protein [Saprospiraceae bacterium]